jgi:ribosomal protein S27E
MAIQIVDKGPHKSVVKEVVCTNCGATLAYTPADVQSKVVADYGGGSDVVKTIHCPQCEHNQSVR